MTSLGKGNEGDKNNQVERHCTKTIRFHFSFSLVAPVPVPSCSQPAYIRWGAGKSGFHIRSPTGAILESSRRTSLWGGDGANTQQRTVETSARRQNCQGAGSLPLQPLKPWSSESTSPGTREKYTFPGPTPDRLDQKLCGLGAALWFMTPLQVSEPLAKRQMPQEHRQPNLEGR